MTIYQYNNNSNISKTISNYDYNNINSNNMPTKQ